MDRNLFAYIWRNSRREQIVVLSLVILSLPFYFYSLDLPKQIVNDAIQGRAFRDGQNTAKFLEISFGWPPFIGGQRIVLFKGLLLEQFQYLFALSGLFLFLVLLNGGFKYVINVQKGALGERMLRRLRFDLFASYLRFRPEAIRGVKPAEAATVIKDEVEPIGGFIGDAFIQPVFLGGQALTALTFILIQNIWLGLLTVAVVATQALIIPRLRREQLRLGKERQIASRKLAGRVGEVVDGMSAVRAHDTVKYEQAEIGGRLGTLFTIRYALFKRKFAVKFLNNLLAQVTPFLFYSVGGYLALTGRLDIGQLVAVIAAYRDLPPPVKELIDWDQQRLDVKVKYDQIVEQVSPLNFAEPAASNVPPETRFLTGDIAIQNVNHADNRGNALLENASLVLPLPGHYALIGSPGGGATSLARILGRDVAEFSGSAAINSVEIATMPAHLAGWRIGFVGPDPVVFPGTIRDNILYGLKSTPRPLDDGASISAAERRRRREARRTGNPIERAEDEWIDFAALGLSGPEDLDDRIIAVLSDIGTGQDVYRFGLGGIIEKDRYPRLAERIVEARRACREALSASGGARLVEPFDPARYNTNATIGENLLFGVPIGDTFNEANLAANPFMRSILESEGLAGPLTDAGLKIAETMVEIFSGLPAGHPMFERFSFISADALPDYAELVSRWKSRRRGPESSEDRDRLRGLPLTYIEPRHRLGIVTDEFAARIVKARLAFAKAIPPSLKPAVEFYNPDTLCSAAPVRDNLLFGRVAYGIATAGDQVQAKIREVLESMGLDREVYRIGLDYQVGPSGRLLFGSQKAAINLARCLIKSPDILILQDALATFGESERAGLLAALRRKQQGRTLIVTMTNAAEAKDFDARIFFENARVKGIESNKVNKPASQAAQ